MSNAKGSICQDLDVTRRGFVMTSLAAGFAVATQPVSAQTITTDSQGLTAGEVKIPVTDGEIPAYRALPASGGPFPVVLVVQEIFGVHEHIKDICRRLAKLGYFAVAPEMYARQGDVSKLKAFPDILKIVNKVPDAQVMSDLDAAVAWAKASGKADTAKLAITGFCWGGRIVWLYSAHNPDLKAGVAWYGRLAEKGDELRPSIPSMSSIRSKRPCLGSTVKPTTQSPWQVWKRCARPSRRPASLAKLCSTPTRPTRSSPITETVTARLKRRTAGSECSRGSRSTKSPDRDLIRAGVPPGSESIAGHEAFGLLSLDASPQDRGARAGDVGSPFSRGVALSWRCRNTGEARDRGREPPIG